MKNINLILVFTLLMACTGNDDDIKNAHLDNFQEYAGHYKIVSYKSDVAVDLNNDAIVSYELMDEINVFRDGDLKIKRNEALRVNIFNLSLPRTSSTLNEFSIIGKPPAFQKYEFMTFFQFENDIFHLEEYEYIEEFYVDYDKRIKNVTLSKQVKVINSDQLMASVKREYYDYNTKEWKDLNIEILFEKSNL